MAELRGVGIDEKGYGKVYKVVMCNSGIPLVAKAIYAYFCSYAGSGTTAFPRREKILKDLRITKNTSTKYLDFLIKAQYISRTRTVLGNIYEIHPIVPDKNGEMVEAKKLGYGTIPKLAMLDERLSTASKAIYAYLCSYAGGGHVAYPHRGTILRELKIGKTSYYQHYSSLIETGYITPTQKTHENGQFTSCSYRLNEVLGIDPAIDPDESPKNALRCDSHIPEHGVVDTASQCDSHNPIHGGKIADSQNPVHGKARVFNTPVNRFSQNPVHGGVAMSQNPVSRQPEPRNLRHPYTNNSIYNKQSDSKESDRINNTRASAGVADSFGTVRPYLSEIKELVDYNFQLREFEAWGKLKKKLGHFPKTQECEAMLAYIARCKEVLNEFVHQLQLVYKGSGGCIEHHGQRYECSELIQKLEVKLTNPADLNETLIEIADKGAEIKNLSAYVKQLVLNLVKGVEIQTVQGLK